MRYGIHDLCEWWGLRGAMSIRRLMENLEPTVWIFVNTKVKRSRCPILDLMARVLSSQISCLFFVTSYIQLIFVSCSQPRHRGQQTAHEQYTNQCRARATTTGYDAIHACRPPAEQETTPCMCGSCPCCFCCGFLLLVGF